MLRDKAFNLSIVFSLVWHLAWISLIGIIVVPSGRPGNFYQEVNFLGPILEKTAFDIMVEEVIPQRETLYASSTLFVDNVYLKPKGPSRKVLKESIPDTVLDKFTFVLWDYVKSAKEIPLYIVHNLTMGHRKVRDKAPSSFVEGPAKKREIIFKAQPPSILRGLYDDAEEYLVKLKFILSTNGIVRNIEPIVSSGYPEIDLHAISSLKKWRFSPLSLIEKDKSTWGVVTVKIIAK